MAAWLSWNRNAPETPLRRTLKSKITQTSSSLETKLQESRERDMRREKSSRGRRSGCELYIKLPRGTPP